MKTDYFPSNRMLEDAVMKSLKLLGGTATTNQINSKVIESVIL